MTKEELKTLGLTDEQIEKVIEDYGKNYVSKDQFNAKNDKLKSVEGELTKVKGEIDELQKANANNEELTKQIETLKAESDKRTADYETKIQKMEIDSIVNTALLGVKAKNTTAVKALLDLTDAKVKDGKIKGLEEQLQEVVKANPYLFGDTVKPNGVGAGTPGDGGAKGITKEDFDKMGYSDRVKLMTEDKALYDEFTGGNTNE